MKYLMKKAAVLGFIFFSVVSTVAASSKDKETSFPDRYGQVSRQLFLGESKNQALIVGLGGSEGGNPWASNHWKNQRDKFVAQGYAFLALGYFGTKESPAQLERISIDAIHAAVMETAQDPRINQRCVILIGGSKGAELALLLASFYQEYDAVVALVPGSAVFPGLTFTMNTSSWMYQDRQLSFVPVKENAYPALLRRDLRAAYEKIMEDSRAMDEAAIQVEKIQGPILLMSATKDEMWPSSEMSQQMMDRLKAKAFPFASQHIAIEGKHAAPLKHFERVEEFLRNQVKKQPDCGNLTIE